MYNLCSFGPLHIPWYFDPLSIGPLALYNLISVPLTTVVLLRHLAQYSVVLVPFVPELGL
jgi:hypothetical protein